MRPLARDEIAHAIQARHLQSPMSLALVLEPDRPAAQCVAEMTERQFDVAPVLTNGHLIGTFASSNRPQGLVGDHLRGLDSSMMVSSDTPVRELVGHLNDEDFLFVLQGREIRGFVTPADMGAAPARTHYYLLLSTLEILLHQYLSKRYPDQPDALVHLSDGARRRQARTESELRAADQFIDTMSTLSLKDLVTLAGKDERFRARATQERGWKWICQHLIPFRDDIMHPSRAFASAERGGLARLLDMEVRLHTLAGAAEACLDDLSGQVREPTPVPAKG